MSLYEDYKNDPNNFSYWFPKIENCGIPVPQSVVVPAPEDVMRCFFMERKNDEDTIAQWVKSDVMPAIADMGSLLFIKNGGFSNKFDFSTCAVTNDFYHLVHSIISINYQSLCFDTGGNTEMVFRKRIGWSDDYEQYHIYNGMPLRPEFRVFYDFDNHKVLYTVNYWDWDYCHDAISRDKSDEIVYEAAYPAIKSFYNEHFREVEDIVSEHMAGITELDGIWSVDLMWCDKQYWLIDMAVVVNSAYFDPDRIEKEDNQ